MNVAVFLSQYDVAGRYTAVVEEFGRLLAARQHTLLFGGGDEGLMHTVADTAHRAGAKVIGVIREQIKDKAYKDADEMVIVGDSREMNRRLIERAGVIAVLPGGVGTLNEVSDVLRMTKNGASAKPIVVVNTHHFYDGLEEQLQRMHAEGFLRDDVMDSIRFAPTPAKAMEYIDAYGN